MDTISVSPTTNTREQRGLRLYRERGSGIERVAPNFYLCPSEDGAEFYHVDYAGETCDCPDYLRNATACKHVYAVDIARAKRRAKASWCDGCGGRFPRRELVEAMEEDLGVFEGE